MGARFLSNLLIYAFYAGAGCRSARCPSGKRWRFLKYEDLYLRAYADEAEYPTGIGDRIVFNNEHLFSPGAG
jgi:hypothetical protein